MMIACARRHAVLLVAAALAAAGSARAQSDPAAAGAFIETLAARALALLGRTDLSLAERESNFRAILGDGFDLAFIGRFVLGRHWASIGDEQRAEYLDLFGEFVLRTYTGRFGGYAGEQFAVVGVRRAGDKDVVVASSVTRVAGAPVLVEWRVRVLDGRPRIVDVAVEGISMAMNQRQEFDAIVAQHGVEGLIAMLRARVAKVTVAAG